MSFVDSVLAASKRRYKIVEVPLLGNVRLQSLTRSEVRTLRDSFTDEEGRINARGNKANELLVASCVVGDEGNDARQVSDEDAIRGFFDGIDDAAFGVLLTSCRAHTNWSQDPTWKDVEAAAKN